MKIQKFNAQIIIILRLYALLVKQILPENIRPPCNYKIIGGMEPPTPPPRTGDAPDLNREEIVGTFYKKEFQQESQKEFRVEEVIKRKGIRLYVKCKGYDNSFNRQIDKI